MFKTDSVRLRLWAAQEAMHGSTRVLVVSRDLSAPVNAHGVGGLLSYVNARGVECGERAVGRPTKAMMYVVRVIIVPRDRTGAVDAPNDGALLERCTGTRRIERGERAVRGPQKAVVRGARVCVGSRDRTGVVNTR